ncbi:unnamed protein product [Brachionus calyciflorus]|uniref:Ankyrin repeat protein n=1 Tax=Brachionus calyciflorus TaxID=104777 RepID=A0A814HVQ5_9BILA|nr:unnamed protein product [Brachionus calyciflorus]
MITPDNTIDQTLFDYLNLIRLKCYHGSLPCHIASKKGYLNIVKILLEKDCSILNSQDDDGNTFLHLASQSGHSNIIKYLLKKNADTDIRNDKGLKPVDIAIKTKCKDVLDILS